MLRLGNTYVYRSEKRNEAVFFFGGVSVIFFLQPKVVRGIGQKALELNGFKERERERVSEAKYKLVAVLLLLLSRS